MVAEDVQEPSSADRSMLSRNNRAARRASMRAWRRALRPADARRLADAAADRAVQVIEGHRGVEAVGTYVTDDGELDTAPLRDALHERGISVWLPIVGREQLAFARWLPGVAMAANRYEIAEPTGPTVEVTALDILVVPVVAVDGRGHRLGRGAGWYDRTLAACDALPMTLGYAYDDQVVDAIDAEPWDVALDAIVTPSRLIVTKAG